MANPAVTYTFSNGTPLDATEVNTNFTDLINSLTDGTKDLSISALTLAGALTANGNVTLGNASADDLTINASLASSIAIKTTNSYDIGSTSLALRSVYIASSDSAAFAQRLIAPTIGANYSMTMPGHTVVCPASDGANGDYLQTNGSGTWSFVGGPGITSKTTTYTATTADKIISVTTSSAWTLTLYAASGNAGRTLRIIKTSSDANALTIDGNGSETINGNTTTTIITQYEILDLICDGSNWLIMNRSCDTAWVSYTPTTQGFGTVTGMNAYWKRVGDTMHILAYWTNGTVTADQAQFGLPNSWTTAFGSASLVGDLVRSNTSANNFFILMNNGLSYLQFGSNSSTVQNASSIFNNSESESFHAIVPITEFKGSNE